jgi:hypothetical protein
VSLDSESRAFRYTAVAGERGLCVFDARKDRWRMFGDVSQERSLDISALMWCRDAILAITRSWGGRLDQPPNNEVHVSKF